MIIASYTALLVLSLWLAWRYSRGMTVEGLIRKAPPGSDLMAVVSNLSYLEHELIKHRIPVVRSLMTKKSWNQQDRSLLSRTLGRGETSLAGEFQRYLDGIQRGAGRVFVNFERDHHFKSALRSVETIQRLGDHWLRLEDGNPSSGERQPVIDACDWLSGVFRKVLIELGQHLFCCQITRDKLLASARRGMIEARSTALLSVDAPPGECVARVLQADLDLAVRNLVRNAVTAHVPEDTPRSIHIDVAEQIDDTGEESLLLRVHDANPVRLRPEQIYGREAKRGLGLVTTALARNRAAVRCVESERPGFTKAMEIRLNRSLHEPDLSLLSAKPNFALLILAILILAAHALLLATIVVPYMSRHPISLSPIQIPNSCELTTFRGAKSAHLTCDLVGPVDILRGDPIELTFSQDHPSLLHTQLIDSDCAEVRWLGLDRLQIQIDHCLEMSRFEQHFSLRFSSLWFLSPSELEITLRAPRERLVAAAESALHRGDLVLVDQILTGLGSREQRLDPEEQLQIQYWRGITAVLAGLSLLISDQPSSPQLCQLLGVASDASARIVAGSDQSPLASRSSWLAYASFLEGQARLWLATDMLSSAEHLEAITNSQDVSPVTLSARFYLAILAGEGAISMSEANLQQILLDLWLFHLRPPLATGSNLQHYFIELIGSSILFGEPQRIPVPEAFCALRQLYPDMVLPDQVRPALNQACQARPLDPLLDGYLRWFGSFLTRNSEPLDCPRER